MNITMKDMKKYIKLLQNIPYYPLHDKSTIFFEIDTGKTVDNGGFIMEIKQTESGAKALVRPGLILSAYETEKGKHFTQVSLAYAAIDYSPEFNLDSYLDLIAGKGSISKKDRDILTTLDAKLVKMNDILAEFEL